MNDDGLDLPAGGDYNLDDLNRAAKLAGEIFERSDFRDLIADMGLDLEHLIIVGGATAMVIDDHPHASFTGAKAFVCGFFVGFGLGGSRPLSGNFADLLSAAIDTIHRCGRHTVVAQWCDLAAVALLENTVRGSLTGSDGQDPEVGTGGRQKPAPTTILLETGLAAGLLTGSARG